MEIKVRQQEGKKESRTIVNNERNSFKSVSSLLGVFRTEYLGSALTGGQGMDVKDVDEQSRHGLDKSNQSDEMEAGGKERKKGTDYDNNDEKMKNVGYDMPYIITNQKFAFYRDLGTATNKI